MIAFDPPGFLCAILFDHTGTEIGITDLGTATELFCHGRLALCAEALSACVNGKVTVSAFDFGFFSVSDTLQPSPVGPALRSMEVLLDFTPGGVTLKPAGQPGSEKLVDFHIDIE